MTSALATWQTLLSYCTAPAYFLLVFILIRRGLWRAYLTFCCFLLVEGTAFALGMALGHRPKLWSWVFLVAQPILLLMAVLMVLEVFRRALVSYPGIARFSQRFILGSLIAALLIAFLLASGEFPGFSSPGDLLMRYALVTRVIDSAVCIYLILIVMFLSWMPVPLPPNTIRHGFFFFFYFLLAAIANLYVNRMGMDVRVQVNLALTALTLVALVLWMIFLDKAGEVTPSFAKKARPADADRYLGRLQAINDTLSRGMD